MTSGDEHGRGRCSAIVAFAGFGLAIAEIATGLIGALVLGLNFADVRDSFVLTNSVIGLSCAIAGVLISWQRPGNPVGWLLLLAGIFQAGTAAAAPLQAPGVRLDVPEPVLRVLGTIAAYSWPWSIALCMPLALLLFPDGHLPGLWRRVVAGSQSPRVCCSPPKWAVIRQRFLGSPGDGWSSRTTPSWAGCGPSRNSSTAWSTWPVWPVW